jgi:hypothetical protein
LTRNESLRTWSIIIGLLLFGAVALVGWQLLNQPRAGTGDPHVQLPPPQVPPLEFRVAEQVYQFEPFQALALLTVLVLAPLALVAAGIAAIFLLLDRQTAQVKEAPEFQSAVTQLNQRESEQIKRLRAGRTTHPRPADPTMPRWSAVSTSIIVVLFVMFVAFMLGRVFLPHETYWRGNLWDPAVLLMWGAAIVTGLIMFLLVRGRERALAAPDDAEEAPPPWAWIWVIVTGLLIVGVGTGISLIIWGTPPG